MTPSQTLYLFLWLLILFECVVRLDKGRVWCVCSWMGWKTPGRGMAFGLAQWNMLLLNPVPCFAGLALPPDPQAEAPLSFNARDLAKKLAPVQSLLFWCGQSATLLFIVPVLLIPAFAIRYSVDVIAIPALAAFEICNVLAVAVWAGCHARLYPGKRAERVKKLLHYLVWPFATMRCAVTLPREYLEGYHPLAVGAALMGPRRAKVWLRETYARMEQPVAEAAQEEGPPPAELAAFAAMLEDLYGEIPRIHSAPAEHDPEARAACPVCGTRYKRADGVCSFCPDVRLVLIEELPPSREAINAQKGGT